MAGKRWAAWLVCAGVLLSGRAAADALSDAGTAFDEAERGNYKLAVRYYTRALWSGELDDTEAAAVYFGRAFAYIKLEQYDKAEEDYDELIELRPDDASAYYNRAVTHAADGDLKEALADYTSAIWLGYDDSYKAFYNRGTIYESQGDFESAVADFKEAYKLRPDEPRILEKIEALGGEPSPEQSSD
jgi:tetratricopeptide (TPR) repeat protein